MMDVIKDNNHAKSVALDAIWKTVYNVIICGIQIKAFVIPNVEMERQLQDLRNVMTVIMYNLMDALIVNTNLNWNALTHNMEFALSVHLDGV